MPKKKKFRCQHPSCKKKLSVVQQIAGKCKCGLITCSAHKTDHVCTYDHSQEAIKAAGTLETAEFKKINKL